MSFSFRVWFSVFPSSSLHHNNPDSQPLQATETEYYSIMPVKHISTMDEYNAVLETSKTKLVIMDFSADWWVDESDVRIFWFPGRSRIVVNHVLDATNLLEVHWQAHFVVPDVQAIWLPRRERWLLYMKIWRARFDVFPFLNPVPITRTFVLCATIHSLTQPCYLVIYSGAGRVNLLDPFLKKWVYVNDL